MDSVDLIRGLFPVDFSSGTLKQILDRIPSAVVDGILESPDRKALCDFVGLSFHLKRPPFPLPGEKKETVLLFPIGDIKRTHLRELGSRAAICLRAAWCERLGLAVVEWPAAIDDKEPPKISAFPDTSQKCVDAFTRDGLQLEIRRGTLGPALGHSFKRNDPRFS